MQVDSEKKSAAEAHRDTPVVTSLTDVIDQYKRAAFKRALERRPDADEYRRKIEAAHLVRHSSS
jgi:hypothetical protein